jgi:hypothetical protein
MRARILVVAALAVAGSCVDRGAGPTRKQIDPAYIAENLLSAPPQGLTNELDADLGGKVIYLGNIVDKSTIAPGDKIEIRHYWQVVAEPGPEWRVFSHVRGDGNTADFMNVDDTDMRFGHGPATWKPGEIIQDVQNFTLKPDWRSKVATVIVGMFPRGKHGINDRMPVRSGKTIDSAVVAVELVVDLAKAPPPPGTIVVRKAQSPIVIDGVAQDPAWGFATVSTEFPTAEGSGDPPGATTGKLTWDDAHLYLFVTATDRDAFSQYTKPDDTLWKNDVVEVFVDADSDRRGYIELQVNPNNTQLDLWWPTTRGGASDLAWSAGMQSAVKVRGTATDRSDTDQGWDVELAIPWAAVKGGNPAMAVRIPPQPGDRIRMNVVRADYARDAKNPTVASWNRITYGDFHALDRMLTVVFADAAGQTQPPSEAPGSGPGSGSGPGTGSGSGPGIGTGSGSGPGTGSGSGPGSGSGAKAPAKSPPIPKRPPPTPAPSPAPSPGSAAPR